jgi:hypothetical protein
MAESIRNTDNHTSQRVDAPPLVWAGSAVVDTLTATAGACECVILLLTTSLEVSLEEGERLYGARIRHF